LTHGPQNVGQYLKSSIILKIVRNGLGLAVGILVLYLWLYFQTGDIVLAQTAVFVAWLIGHIFLALNLKQEKILLSKQGIFSNKFGLLWLSAMVVFSVVVTNVPVLFPLLQTTSLPINVWIIVLIVVFASTFWIEARKVLFKNVVG
jgi:Ca2+-transporting ATPase